MGLECQFMIKDFRYNPSVMIMDHIGFNANSFDSELLYFEEQGWKTCNIWRCLD